MKRSNSDISTCKRALDPSAERMLSYFDERRGIFRKALKAARSYYAIEGIHDLRLEIKRFRVLYKLIDCAAPSFASKPNLAVFKELFRASGTLRDIDIHQAIALRELEKSDLSEYFNYLKQKELDLRSDFRYEASKFSLSAISQSRRQIVSALAAVDGENQRKRIRKKILKFVPRLKGLMQKNKSGRKDLHTIRKLAKVLRYSMDIWQACFEKTTLTENISNELKKTYQSLGGWHDYLLTHDSVDLFFSREAKDGVEDPTAYTTFQKYLKRQAKSFLEEYERGKNPLLKSLKRLASGFH